MNDDRILRFSQAERIAHWVHTASFFLLLLTGLIVMSQKFLFLSALFGGVQTARIIHKAAGLVFGFGTLAIFILGDAKSFGRWIKDITTWGKVDIDFLREFPKEFLGGHANLPEQGRFNSGEKVNSLFVLMGGGLLLISGLMMWFADVVPLGIIRWVYPLHNLLALLMAAVVIAHMYLGLLHPGSKEAINGMLRGTVTRAFARSHHAKWYREVTGEEKPK